MKLEHDLTYNPVYTVRQSWQVPTQPPPTIEKKISPHPHKHI